MDAEKGKTRKESTPIKVWVTPEECASAFAAIAAFLRISVLTYSVINSK
jgi:hypothetical protein